MSVAPMRDLDLAGAVNLRDLGGFAACAGQTRWRNLLRSGGLHGLTGDSIQTLRQMGLRTVIDLRHAGEQARCPNPFADCTQIALHQVSLFKGLAPDELARDGAVLPALYRRAAQTRAAQMAEVLRLIADAPPGIVLFYCTAGKDRTGLIAGLILTLCGVERTEIGADYALTGPRIQRHIPAMMQDALQDGMTEDRLAPLFGSSPENILGFLDFLDAEFSGVEPFLAQAGLSQARMQKLRRRLMA